MMRKYLQTHERLVEFLDELAASEEVREVLAKDAGKRVELADVARKDGFDPSEFGLQADVGRCGDFRLRLSTLLQSRSFSTFPQATAAPGFRASRRRFEREPATGQALRFRLRHRQPLG
jgi:hypothetical protein